MFKSFLIVAAGGAIGSVFRYGLSLLPFSKVFPAATFITNIAGSLLIGILAAMLYKNVIDSNLWKFLAVGICGGFTTFSAFSLEGFNMLQQQLYTNFLLYIVASVAVGLVAVSSGFILANHLIK